MSAPPWVFVVVVFAPSTVEECVVKSIIAEFGGAGFAFGEKTCERPRTRLFASRALHRAETCEHVNARDAPQNASARVGMFASRLSYTLGCQRTIPLRKPGTA